MIATGITDPGFAPLARAIFARARAALLRFEKLARAYHNRSNAAVLAALDDRMLADIGLTRSDLSDAFAEPLWRDPTDLLRARALERRLQRHGVSLGLADRSVASPPLSPEQEFNVPRTDRPARFTV